VEDPEQRRFHAPYTEIEMTLSVKRALRIIWLLAIIIVIVGSLLPATSIPMKALDSLNINDKLEHVAAYVVLSFLPALHERRPFIIAAALGCAALGVALEFGQLLSGWRDFEIGDMVADAAGVIIGLAIAVPLRRIACHPKLLRTSKPPR
jgi:VanZ family protein